MKKRDMCRRGGEPRRVGEGQKGERAGEYREDILKGGREDGVCWEGGTKEGCRLARGDRVAHPFTAQSTACRPSLPDWIQRGWAVPQATTRSYKKQLLQEATRSSYYKKQLLQDAA